jgi:antitoxin YefM
MDAISYSAARANLAKTMERVCDDHAPVIITRKRENPVVMMSLEDYQSMQETTYLLRSPENTKRLMSAIEELENGGGEAKELLE